MNFTDTAQQLRANFYAPAPLRKGHRVPEGPWAVSQVPYQRFDYGDADASLLLALRPAFGPGLGVVERPQDTWLATLTITVKPEMAAGVDDVVLKHIGGTVKSPVLALPDGTTVRLFRMTGPTPFEPVTTDFSLRPDIARIESTGFLALGAGQWRGGSPLTVPRDDLPVMDRSRANQLIADLNGYLWAQQPVAPPALLRPVKPPRLPPMAKLTWGDTDAIERLAEYGYSVCCVDDSDVGLRTNATTATQVGAVHVTTKVPEVLELLTERFEGAPVRVAADGTRTYFLQTAGQWRNFDRAIAGRDAAGNVVPGAGVQVSVEASNSVLLLSGGRWTGSLLDTKRQDLPPLLDVQGLLGELERVLEQRAQAA